MKKTVLFCALMFGLSLGTASSASAQTLTVTLSDGDSFDFVNATKGSYSGGDLYYSAATPEFDCNNDWQRGVANLGNLGSVSFDSITPPATGYTSWSIPVVVGNTYVALVSSNTNAEYTVFRVISQTSTSVTLCYEVYVNSNQPLGFLVQPGRDCFWESNALPETLEVCAAETNQTPLAATALGQNVIYQWQQNGVDVPGATLPIITFNNATTSASGIYRLRISNASGSILSDPAQVTVLPPAAPVFTAQPNPTVFIAIGANGTLSYTYTGVPPTYPTDVAFYKDNAPISIAPGTIIPEWGPAGPSDISTYTAGLNLFNATMATAGVYTATVTNSQGATTSSPVTVQVGVPITGFTPVGGVSGDTITISGMGFTGATAVQFNGTSASFTVISDSQIQAVVPFNATSGPITVVTPSGTFNSSSFTVTGPPVPIITSVTPASGPTDRIVVIDGYNFQSPSILFNGASIGGMLSSSGTQILAFVPLGATSGPITIQTPEGATTSATNFVVAAGGPPANDNFANAQPLSGVSGSFSGNTANATKEAGEPNHAGNPGGASVWFTWTAPSSGYYVFDPTGTGPSGVFGTTGSDFGVLLGIYTGTSVSALTPVASASSGAPTPTFSSATVLNAAAGTTYDIAIDGFNGPQTYGAVMGDYTLAWSPLAAPTITNFTPTTGYAGQYVTITGTGFVPGATVTIGGATTNPNQTGIISSSTINGAPIPANAVTGPITITTPAGTVTTSTNFTVVAAPPPTISSFSPSSATPGSSVNIFGASFTTTTAVLFNGISATFTVFGDTYIQATVPPGAASGTITVTTSTGTASSSTPFTATTPPAPVINNFSTNDAPIGSTVFIYGSYFTGATAVLFNGVNATFTVYGDTEIGAVVPTGATSGPISVTTSGGSTASAGTFTVNVPPTITSFSPTAIAPGMPVTITGTGFTNAGIVQFYNGSYAGFTVNSDTQITATAPYGLPASGTISVTTSGGTATSTTSYTLTQVPIITSITPTSGSTNRIVVINGYNFQSPSILFNGVSLGGELSWRETQILAFVPLGATTGPITVQTSQGTATSATNFVVAAGPPPDNDNFANAQPLAGASGSFSGNTANATKEAGEPNHAGNSGGASVWFTWTAPSSGYYLFDPVGTGPDGVFGTTGSDFGVLLGIYTGTSVNALTPVASGSSESPTPFFSSATVLNAVAGTTYDIAIDGFNGPQTYGAVMGDYTLAWSPLAAPTITNFGPTTGYPGQDFYITGTRFVPGATVTIGGAPTDPNRTEILSSTAISGIPIPANAVTGPITITTPAGTVTTSTNFTVVAPPPPIISSFSPSSATPGSFVNIFGSSLTSTTAVLFNGISATFTVLGDTFIQATVPPGAASGTITVTTLAGAASSSTAFTAIAPPVPVITSFSPDNVAAGSSVYIYGSGFTGTTAVSFNGSNAAFTLFGDAEIQATVPAGATSGPISVTAPGGTTISPSTFTVNVPVPPLVGFSNLSTNNFVGGGAADIFGVFTVEGSQPKQMLIRGVGPSLSQFGLPNALADPAITVSNAATGAVVASNDNWGNSTAVTQAASQAGAFPLLANSLDAALVSTFSPGTYTIHVSGNGGATGIALMDFYSLDSVPRVPYIASRINLGVGATGSVGFFVPGTASQTVLVRAIGPSLGLGGALQAPVLSVLNSSQTVMATNTGWGGAPALAGAAGTAGLQPLAANSADSAVLVTLPPGTYIAQVKGAGTTGGLALIEITVIDSNRPTASSPAIVSQTQNFSVTAGQPASLGVVAVGLPAPTFQWRLNGTPIGGAVSSQYTIPSAQSGNAGAYDVIVTNANGSAQSVPANLTVITPPAPTFGGFSTSSATAGSSISIFGSAFTGATAVLFGGINATFTVISDTQINAVVPSGAVSGAVTITTPSGTVSSSANFTVIPPAPAITSFSPGSGVSGTSVSILGSAFTGATSVLFNGTSAAFTVVSDTQINATVPAGATTGPIFIFTPGGSVSSSTIFTVNAGPPTISSFSPVSGGINQLVTLNGSNFIGSGITLLGVQVNGVSVGLVSSQATTRILFAVPAGAASGPITVQTSQGTVTSASNFVVAAGTPPANDNFANAQLISGASGTISGTNSNATKEPGEPSNTENSGGASVWFAWTAPSSACYLFDPTGSNFGTVLEAYTGTSVNALAPVIGGSAIGEFSTSFFGAIALNAVAGTTYYIALDGFNGVMGNYTLTWSPLALSAPALTSISPTTGYPGQLIALMGTGFVPGMIVTVGGVTADRLHTIVNSSTIATFPAPLTAATGPIVITTPGGTTTSSTNLTIVSPPPPTIARFTFGSGSAGSQVQIIGTALWLGDAPIVKFNGVQASSVFPTSGTTLVASVPSGATTGPITVQTDAGTATSPTNFIVTSPAVTTLNPSPVSANSGAFTLSITGGGFLSGSTVLWNGSPRATTVADANDLTVAIPASDIVSTAGVTAALITVQNPSGFISNTAALPIVSSGVASVQSSPALSGGSGTASTAPTTAGGAGATATLQNNAPSGQPAAVSVADYSSNPTGVSYIDVGGQYVDVEVAGADPADSAAVNFYYPSTITGSTEASLQLLYFDGAAWQPVLSSGGVAPVKNTTDNLDGTVSGGRFAVTFDSTSTPAITNLTGTVFTVSQTNVSQSITLSPATQTITAGGAVSFTAANGQNGYSWSVLPAGPTGISGAGASQTLTFPTAGTYTVSAQSPGGGGYLASNVATATITVNSSVVVPVSFSISSDKFIYSGSAQGPTVITSPAGAPFTVTGTASATAVGEYSFKATAAGGDRGSHTFHWSIVKAESALTYSAPAAITYGTAITAVQLDAAANVAGSFVYRFNGDDITAGEGIVPNVGTHRLTAIFTPTDMADYHRDRITTTLTVNPAAVSFSISPASFAYDGSIHRPTVTASPSDATYDVTGSDSAREGGTYSFTVTARGNYSGSQTFTWSISQAAPVLTYTAHAAINYGKAITAEELNAKANAPGSFTYTLDGIPVTSGSGVIPTAGVHTLIATFIPANPADYAGGTVSTTLTVNQISPVLTYPTPAAIDYGTAITAAQLNATADVSGSFTYTLDGSPVTAVSGTIAAAGTHTLVATFTPADATDYTPATISRTLTIRTVAATFSLSSTSFVYTGSNQGPTVIASPSGATFAVSGTTSASAIAKYSLTVTATGNYKGSQTLSWSIVKAGH